MQGPNKLRIFVFPFCFLLIVGTAVGQESSVARGASGPNGAVAQTSGKESHTDDPPALQRRDVRYTVHSSDTLQLTFPLTPEFNQTVMVQPDGFVSLMGVGEVPVAGQTLPEVTASLAKAYSPILKQPMIYVNPTDYEKPYFVVGGQVGKPGKFDWRGDVTVTQAIAIAGGFTDAAKHSQVILFRRVSDQWVHGELIDVKHMLSERNLSEDVVLEPGDMLYVPKNRISKIKPFIPLPNLGMYLNPNQF